MRASDENLCTNATGLRHQLRVRQDPRISKLLGDNNLVIAL
jgi:hypothetical protein